jgi:hypothetical protein
LKQNGIGFGLGAGSRRAHTKLQISFSQDLLGVESIFADYVRDLYFRTAQREIDRRCHSEKKNNRDRNNDCDTAGD